MSVLLVNPPTAKICEPPAGIARLKGALEDHGIACTAVDLNLECMLDMINEPCNAQDTWTKRAEKNRKKHLDSLRSSATYQHPDRYRRAVNDINRLLVVNSKKSNCDISLSNFADKARSPLKSTDLLDAAKHFSDNPFFSAFSRRLDVLIKEYNPSVIGLSLSYLSQAVTGFAILGYIRSHYPAITSVIGGSLITSWMNGPEWVNRFSSYADHIVRGPGEKALLAITGTVVSDITGRPDFSDFALSDYLAPGKIIPYSASDGCYWNKCTFCPDHAENNRYRANSAQRVHRETSTLVSVHKPLLIHFLDNAISPALMKYLTEHPPGVAWYGFARIEKDLERPEFCEALRKSGCLMLKLGIESGSQQVLNKMEKGIEIDRASRVLHNLERAGISTYVYLLFGTPFESQAEAEKTLAFTKEHHHCITFLNLAIFNMPVCSKEALNTPDRFSDGDLSLYCDFRHPTGWDRKAVRRFLENQFRKDPLINEIVKRDPPFFTSNHAPFFQSRGDITTSSETIGTCFPNVRPKSFSL